MKTLFESLIDIDSIDVDSNIIKYITKYDFKNLYIKRSRLISNIDDENPVCIKGNDEPLIGLCRDLKSKSIDVSGLFPDSKIKSLQFFAADCKYLKDFRGPNKHINYSYISTLQNFFSADTKLERFDLSGIAESAKNIEKIDHMFSSCGSLKKIDLSSFNFTNLSDCIGSFAYCANLKQIDLGNSNAVINADGMCENSINLEEFNAPNMILSGSRIFCNCESLRRINVKYIDATKDFISTFSMCNKLEDVKIYGLSSVAGRLTDMGYFCIDFSWAISLNDKSWNYLFENMENGKGISLRLPDTSKKEKLIEKYGLIAEQHSFKLI